MAQRESCERCDHKLSCKEAFKRLGNIRGQSIVRSVLVAFVLPLLIFIACLAAAQQILTRYIKSSSLCSAVALLLAIAAAVVCVAVVKTVGKRLGKS
jgi:uncharacterized membrane protein YoaK (UPF0700 family)